VTASFSTYQKTTGQCCQKQPKNNIFNSLYFCQILTYKHNYGKHHSLRVISSFHQFIQV